MPNLNHAFPWGVYIGDCTDKKQSIPICLDSQQGGFAVLFDDNGEDTANNFIENVVLQLLNVLPTGDLQIDTFDFSHKNRFMYLSALKEEKLYSVAFNSSEASKKFDVLEQISQHRHHNLLSFQAPTLSEYNQKNSAFIEKYHLLIINLEHYPDDAVNYKRLTAFFDSPYKAGFYVIFLGNHSLLGSEDKSTQHLLNTFPKIHVKNDTVSLSKDAIRLSLLTETYGFIYVNEDKRAIVENLLAKVKQNDVKTSSEFISVPIAKTIDGRRDISFVLGDKNQNYHAFITGVSGSGKTTLLNNIILGIAENYTIQEVRLYLMDYKQGTEFNIFKNHPNCEKIFLDNKDLQAAISLLESFVSMIEQRAKLFAANDDVHITDIGKYNAVYPDKPLHRIILIIDEVHRLFIGDFMQKEHFSNLLKEVVRQGRAYGLHIILSTQTLVGTEIDRELMSQITVRLSFKLTDIADAEKIFTYGNEDALTLHERELIYNNNSGQKASNVLCRANPPSNIEATIRQIRAKKEANQMLVPTIVGSESEVKAANTKVDMPNQENTDKAKNYDTQSDVDFLQQLINEGKIEPPTGFENLSSGRNIND
jgi:energy-coupling factor transporter ATP-binding protein EcfA2